MLSRITNGLATNNGTEVCSTCQDDDEVDNCTLEEFTEAITDDDRYGFGFSAQDVNGFRY